VTPAAEGGARFETMVTGQPSLDQTIIPDAVDRPLGDADCRGTQRAEWSADGLRVFTRAQLTCDGELQPRRISGITMLAPDGTWLDIQAIDGGASNTVRVRRYARDADEQAVGRAPLGASRLSLEDVKEASARVTPLALEAALVETNAGFDLRGSELIDLDESGVPDRVIDLIVALSYPEQFIVERQTSGGAQTIFLNDPFAFGPFGFPGYFNSYYYSPYFYSPFGYYRAGVYDGGYVAIPGGGGPVVIPPQPSGAGRAVDGQGYTRIRPRDPGQEPDGPSGSAPRARSTAASSSAPSGDSGSSSSSSSSSSSGGGSSAGGGGYSAGSSSGDTGRTAQPR
jgi:uncharacterized membrane protein YgcG